jgi:hypothetical protein
MTTLLTFFDRNYCARGVVMVDSLLAAAPETAILVLALDPETETLLSALYGDRVRVLPSDYVGRRWPDLDRMKAKRTHWEYTAMRKPCLLRSVLKEELPSGALLVYLDSDTQVFAGLDPALRAMANASIGLSPHGFSDRNARLARYGRYNAGFMVLRNDELGRICMRDWAEACVRWCHARVEGDKYMNQGYLTRWPSRYPAVVELTHPGLNLAPWNVDKRRLEDARGELRVDGEPLIFYHFHDMTREGGVWRNTSALIERDAQPALFTHLYDPYVRRLAQAEARLRALGFDPDAPMRLKSDAAV